MRVQPRRSPSDVQTASDPGSRTRGCAEHSKGCNGQCAAVLGLEKLYREGRGSQVVPVTTAMGGPGLGNATELSGQRACEAAKLRPGECVRELPSQVGVRAQADSTHTHTHTQRTVCKEYEWHWAWAMGRETREGGMAAGVCSSGPGAARKARRQLREIAASQRRSVAGLWNV